MADDQTDPARLSRAGACAERYSCCVEPSHRQQRRRCESGRTAVPGVARRSLCRARLCRDLPIGGRAVGMWPDPRTAAFQVPQSFGLPGGGRHDAPAPGEMRRRRHRCRSSASQGICRRPMSHGRTHARRLAGRSLRPTRCRTSGRVGVSRRATTAGPSADRRPAAAWTRCVHRSVMRCRIPVAPSTRRESRSPDSGVAGTSRLRAAAAGPGRPGRSKAEGARYVRRRDGYVGESR